MLDEDPMPKSSGSSMGIERMYQIYEKLNSAENKTNLETEYRQFLDAAHRSDKEKRLASQFITRFVEYFPDSYDDAANAMLDLCEEEDPVIRKQVLKDLITVCKKVRTCVPKIADVFCQLMFTADSAEMTNIHTGFTSLFHIDARGTVAGIFSHIRDGNKVVRDAAIKILVTRVKDLSPEIATLQFQHCLFTEIKQVIRNVTEEEFSVFMDLAMSTRLAKKEGGQQLVLDIIYEHLSDDVIDINDNTNISCLFTATDLAITILNAENQIQPNRLIVYYFTKVLPIFSELKKQPNSLYFQQGILKRISELLVHLTTMDEPDLRRCLDSAMNFAFEVLPLISAEDDEATEKVDEIDDTGLKMVNLNFTHAEASLFYIHKLGSLLPDYLPAHERYAEFRSRMEYLNRGATAFERKLREEFQDHETKKIDFRALENKNKINSLKVLKSLNTLIRDLFQKPPKYTGTLLPSWKPLATTKKRPPTSSSLVGLGAAGLGASKALRGGKDREIQRYQPPGGKYSRGGSTFGGFSGSRGTGRGGPAGNRGARGAGRGGWNNRGGFRRGRF